MNQSPTNRHEPLFALRSAIRDVRMRYDRLERGRTAPIRRCRSANELALEGAYWRIGDALAREQRHFVHVVLLFPLAKHATNERFSFGRYLHRQVGDRDNAVMRFRRLLDSRDRDELDHRLRGMLRLAGADDVPVDCGVLGTDILWFFADSDSVRRRWAQDFYAPISVEPSAEAPTSTSTSASNA